MKLFLCLFLISTFAFGARQTINGNLNVNGQLITASTTKGSRPCPSMTEVQRDAVLSPSNGDCIFNSTSSKLNLYNSTTLAWAEVSGSGSSASLLTNPGFESGTGSWTLTAGAGTSETTNIIEGSKSYKAALTAQTLALFQDSTALASQFNGTVQGMASVRVKTTVAGVSVCSRNAGVTSTTNCATVTNNGNWQMLRVPFVLSATSNGISIVSSGAVTGDVYVDDAFVGVAADFDTVPVVTTWKTYTPIITGCAADPITFSYRQVGDTYEVEGTLECDTPNASSFGISLPNSGSIDSSKVSFFGAVGVLDGTLHATNNAGGNGIFATNTALKPIANSPLTTVYFVSTAGADAGSFVTGNAVTGSGAFNPGANISVSFKVPITGLSSAVNTWSDSGPREVFFKATNIAATTVIAANSGTIALKPSVVQNNLGGGGYNAATGEYTIAEDGLYTIFGKCYVGMASGMQSLGATVNGNLQTYAPAIYGNLSHEQTLYWKGKLVKNDVVTIRPFQTSGSGTGTWDCASIYTGTFIVQKEITPSMITASLKDTPKTIGSSGSNIQTVHFGTGTDCSTGACTITYQVGNLITAVNWIAAGTYRLMGLDFNKYHCHGTGLWNNGNGYSLIGADVSGSSTYVEVRSVATSTGANVNASSAKVTCTGKQ